MFTITVDKMTWINNSADDPHDLCAHGHVAAVMGNERFEYNGTASSTALYLLKTLTEDHIIGEGNQMIPCCGRFIIANDNLDNVEILGCANGIDWSVIHENSDTVKLITPNGNETLIPVEEYRKTVFEFADKVEKFYKDCSDKILPEDEFEKNGYIAFWNEWNRRRYGK